MGYLAQIFLSLFKQLLNSKGRAYFVPTGSQLEKLSIALDGDGSNRIGTTERLVNDGNHVFDSIFPDNPNFTDGTGNPLDNDCDDWERRLGLQQWGVTGAATPTRIQRMAAIAQKRRYPGTDAPRQSASYLQNALQAAGFSVYVFENPMNLTPEDILGTTAGLAEYDAFEYGEVEYGDDWSIDDITIIANSVDPAIDDSFAWPPTNNHGIFFIGAPTLGSFASVPAIQETQFRQLVLNLKPAHMVAVTFITFT